LSQKKKKKGGVMNLVWLRFREWQLFVFIWYVLLLMPLNLLLVFELDTKGAISQMYDCHVFRKLIVKLETINGTHSKVGDMV
jgi:hypothetical protein